MKIRGEGGIISLSKLTPWEEQQLRTLTRTRNEDSPFSFSHALENYEKLKNYTYTSIIALYGCSSCEAEIQLVERGWPARIFKNKLFGYYCSNPHCKFYHKFIPAEKAQQLIFLSSVPMAHLATENWLSENQNTEKGASK